MALALLQIYKEIDVTNKGHITREELEEYADISGKGQKFADVRISLL